MALSIRALLVFVAPPPNAGADDPKKPFRDVVVVVVGGGGGGGVDIDLVLGVNAVVEPLKVIAAAATSSA